jgi:hypothetical protein
VIETTHPKEDEPLVASLPDWLALPGAKPEQLFKGLGSDGRIRDDQITEAVALLAKQPNLLPHAYDLIRIAHKPKTPFRADLNLFGRRIVSNAVPELANWLQDREITAVEELQRLANWAKRGLGTKDSRLKRQSELVLGIGLCVLLAQRPVKAATILSIVSEAFGTTAPAGASDTRPERAVIELISRSKPRQIAVLSKVAQLQDAAVKVAQAEAARDGAALRTAEKHIGSLEAELKAERASASDLRGEVAALEAGNAALKKRLTSTQELGAHDLEDLKIRYRNLLHRKLKPKTTDALDALEIEPPKPDFSKTFVSQILAEIDKEIAWLNEHSA